METQRMEEARTRKRKEEERRALQYRTQKDLKHKGSLKICARSMAKDFLKNFRRDTFQELRDEGILRDPRQYSLINDFLPALKKMMATATQNKKLFEEGNDEVVMTTLRENSRVHKQAIQKEAKRIEEKRKEEMRIQQEKEEARRIRREARAALREKRRVNEIRNHVINELVNPTEMADFKPDLHRISDVRDPDSHHPSIYVIGGFMAELLLVLTCLHDYILANPQNQGFEFQAEQVRAFIRDLLFGSNFPENAMTLNLKPIPHDSEP